jgi:hypothetical protein
VSTSVQVFILASCIAGLIGFASAWVSLFKRPENKFFGWRDCVSVGALSLASLAALLRIVLPGLMPAANWGTGAGVDAQIHVVQVLTKVSVRLCALALVVGLVGRPRFILPIALACFGTAVFWIMSTVP